MRGLYSLSPQSIAHVDKAAGKNKKMKKMDEGQYSLKLLKSADAGAHATKVMRAHTV